MAANNNEVPSVLNSASPSSTDDKSSGADSAEKKKTLNVKKKKDNSKDDDDDDDDDAKKNSSKGVNPNVDLLDSVIRKYEGMLARWDKISYQSLLSLMTGLLTGAVAGVAALLLNVALGAAVGIGFLAGVLGLLGAYLWFRRKRANLEKAQERLNDIIGQQKRNQTAVLEQLLYLKKLTELNAEPSLIAVARATLTPLEKESENLSSAFKAVSMDIARQLGATDTDQGKIGDQLTTDLISPQQEATQALASISSANDQSSNDDAKKKEMRRLAEQKKASQHTKK